MIKENRTSKYLLYAIGEVVLVVIGILIALSINNWNENRKAIIKEKNHIQSIYQDLKNEIKRIDANRVTLSNQYTIGFEVLRALELREVQAIDSAKIATNFSSVLSEVVPVDRKGNTWDGLKVLGTETFIINDSLTTSLNTFYANFDWQIERFNQLPKKIRQDLRELTGSCHNSKDIEEINKNGLHFYTMNSYTIHCILSIEEIPKIVRAITVSAIVNKNIYTDLIQNAESIMNYMEYHFDFIESKAL